MPSVSEFVLKCDSCVQNLGEEETPAPRSIETTFKMKQRFSSLDVKVIANELSKSLVSLRVSNIYDLSSRIFLIKLAKPDHREQLLIDSGFRCHLTSFARTTAGTPSIFVARLRKFLKTRRITSVSQIGTDRILEFQFSDGQYRLFLEFYAGGNIVLTDRDLSVLALLRNVSEGEEHEHLRVGITYNLSERQNYNGTPPVNVDTIQKGLEAYRERLKAQEGAKKAGKSKKKAGDHLTRALAAATNQFPPPLIEHVLRSADLEVSMQPDDALNDHSILERIQSALQNAGSIVDGILTNDVIKGYIVAKPRSSPNQNTDQTTKPDKKDGTENLIYFDFYPFVPAQFKADPNNQFLDFEGFNKTVDEFFSSIEGQKLESRVQERQEAANKKIDHAKKQQEDRISGLRAVQDLNVRKAEAIEANIERVEEAVAAINGLIGQGIDWVEIDRIIELEHKRDNPVAAIIKLPLKLKENTATFLLDEWTDEKEADEAYETGSEPSDSDDDEPEEAVSGRKKGAKPDSKTKPADNRIAVDIDLGVSAWSNAREYHEQKKTAANKQEKTEESQEIAFRNAKKKIEHDLQKSLKQEKVSLRAVRKQAWFEKFIYFLSSDGYLVLGGRDANQNEILLKKHFQKGDVYVHADLKGAMPMIIKNRVNSADAPIPPTTLGQAGNLSVCTSSAWESKAVMSAWWANSEQVTKIANTGDYLPPGEVYIKGQKNFLPPAQLLLGFAVAFRISDASKAHHMKHRMTDNSENKARQEEPEPELVDDGTATGSQDFEAKNGVEQEEADDDDNYDDDGDNMQSDDDENESKNESEDDDEGQSYANPLQPTNLGSQREKEEISSDEANAQAPQRDIDEENQAEPDNTEEAGSNGDESDKDTADMSETATDPNSTGTSQNQAKQKGKPQVRGKRGKKAKMAAKYKDQDEEDREAALRILGSRIGQERAEAEAEAKAAAQAKAEEDKERRRQQHLRAQEEGRKREEARLRKEIDSAQDEEEEEDDTAKAVDLETLVGSPLPGDEILDALPICAPWSALARYKYKAKMQPGSGKKGKAIKEILGTWKTVSARKGVFDEKSQDTERMWPREVELIKGFNEVELINVLPVGKVRVMMRDASSSGGKGGGGGKGKGRGGKGSKKR